jgi:hypothetical protein
MSRKKKTNRKKPAPVTDTVTEPALKTTPAAVMDAMDFAQRLGTVTGHIKGFRDGIAAPRNVGEQRAKDQGPFVARILQEVFLETKSALRKHGPQHSPHEGIAVLQEEVDELWDEIKANRGRQASARAEAIQVAAMAVRYVLDNDPR